jgi:4-hydroxy-3-methylbut-2-en-1-yl diphosphate reductase
MKRFDVPIIYRSPLIAAIKNRRRLEDKMKKDFSPTFLDFGPLQVYLARHFGFCYGVENAIEIAFRTLEQNPGKRIFLLSEMIHNPHVNADLVKRGVQFLQDPGGKELVPFDALTPDDVVLIPAFGTTLDIEKKLTDIGIPVQQYNTTCPFVEKVWNRSAQIARLDYTVVVHGKPTHEETRATFSHAAAGAPTVIVKDMDEAVLLGECITGKKTGGDFYTLFNGRYSTGFDTDRDLKKIGVVNQTTMLASETQAIADHLKKAMAERFGTENTEEHFADTRDTLCYATLDNQASVSALLETDADLAIVVGGYNSSNTTHLVELCEKKLPTYFISSAENIASQDKILHYDLHSRVETETLSFLPQRRPVKVLLTSGASCPDALVEGVMEKLLSFFSTEITMDQLTASFT